ncbi:MAG: FAD-dependent oxidoreductase [Chloroflexi bacterium]|nr:FAD-dependent oxidoreductase [Chloroflexota bacterium]
MIALSPRVKAFPRLFEPGQIGTMTVPGRIVMAPMGTYLNHADCGISDRAIAYYGRRAIGGTHLIISECTAVDGPLSSVYPTEPRLDEDGFIAGHHSLTDAIQCLGAKIAAQLHHAGWRSHVMGTAGLPPVSPSPLPITGAKWVPRELTIAEIEQLVDKFGRAAVRARQAGYDAVEVHGAHGYLIHQFMSPYINRRTDMYGGSTENRMRFPVQIVKRIKELAGRDYPVIFRFTAEETRDDGYKLDEARAFARMIEAAGADALHVSMGSAAPEDKNGVGINVCPMSFAQGWRIAYTEAIKREVKVPVITVGVIRDAEVAESFIREGKADFIALGRALLADADWANKAAEGRPEDIRKCTSCNWCHGLGHQRIISRRCAVNAELGREREFAEIKPVAVKKKVMIVGAGPAGMEAARVAALRGHQVILYEKEEALGDGQLKLAAAAPHKEKWIWFRDYLTTQVSKLNIEVHLGTEVTPAIVARARPDVVILATGAKPLVPDIPGVDGANVCTAHDILGGKVGLKGRRVAVLGGRLVGCETAEFLAERGNTVTIVCRSPASQLAEGLSGSNRPDMLVRLKQHKVRVIAEHDVREVTDKGLVLIDKNWRTSFLEVDSVVIARGAVPVGDLARRLKGSEFEVYAIGDCAEVRDIPSATFEGSLVGRKI